MSTDVLVSDGPPPMSLAEWSSRSSVVEAVERLFELEEERRTILKELCKKQLGQSSANALAALACYLAG